MKAVAETIFVSLVLIILCSTGRTEPLLLRSSTVDLHSEDDQINRVGALKFQGGLDLTSRDPRFGGISGLAVSADGNRLSGVTDRGAWVQFTPTLSPNGRLTGIATALIGDLRNLDGKPLRYKRDSDAESLTRIDDGFAVSFEHRHRLWSYRGALNPFQARPTIIAIPAIARAVGVNKGWETIARLQDGRLIAIAEDSPADAPYAQGWIFKEKRWRGFRYRRHALFLPAGAATLPDGNLLVLERRFTLIGGFATRLVTLTSQSIRPDADLTGRELARLEPPLVAENFEGVASHRTKAGETILYLISDDNFFALQRTILLKFAFAN